MSTGTAASRASATRAVLDASAVVRALVYLEPDAQSWFATPLVWPTLVYVEVAHGVLRLQRTGRISLDDAERSLDTLHHATADARPVKPLVGGAWSVASERNLSVYDACYVVLAEALGAPLVTADRRLAEATPNAVLLT